MIDEKILRLQTGNKISVITIPERRVMMGLDVVYCGFPERVKHGRVETKGFLQRDVLNLAIFLLLIQKKKIIMKNWPQEQLWDMTRNRIRLMLNSLCLDISS